jgi:RES domain-containing protein
VIDAASVASAPQTSFEGIAYRHVAPGYDPRSGLGARIHGGRFNPPDSFPVLYLCLTRPCVVAELNRAGERQTIGVAGLLPRVLYEYRVELTNVLDLRDAATQRALELTARQLIASDWHATQQLGVTAQATGIAAICSPSATGVDDTLAVVADSAATERLDARELEPWERVSDVQ